MRKTWISAAIVLSMTAAADAVVIPIEIVARGEGRIVADGRFGDWRRFTELIAIDDAAQVQSGQTSWSGSDDASVGFALARDEQFLYVAAEVRDERVVRSREHRGADDALLISLAVQQGGRPIGFDIAIYPGNPGQFGGSVEFRGARSGAIAGARVVEDNLQGGGFTVEATIPWSALPGLRDNLASLRGRVAYQDNDNPVAQRVETVIATGPGDARNPTQLPAGRGSQGAVSTDLVAQFRTTMGLAGADTFLDRSGNIAGDAALERIVVFPRYAVAVGPGIAGGTRYAYLEHSIRSSDDLVEVILRDLTGDGRLDLVMRGRVTDGGMTREILRVYGAPTGDQLELLFSHELSRAQGAMRVTNRATFEAGNRIRVTLGASEGFTERNFPRTTEPGVIMALTPWGQNRVVSYRWADGVNRFEPAETEPNPTARGAGVGAVASTVPATGAMAVAPTDVAGVLSLFRQRAGVSATARPEFTASANVAEDRQAETVQIYGRFLVVVGPGYQGGRSYYQVDIPEGFTPMALDLADVTNDGHADAIVRTRRQSDVQVRGAAVHMEKDFLLVYSFDAAHRGRVFAAEVGRHVGPASIVNEVRGLARGTGDSITIAPGRASGWNEQSYPFRDTPPQGFAPLMLPWSARAPITYRWNGTTLAAQ